jgi:hypothetical protein
MGWRRTPIPALASLTLALAAVAAGCVSPLAPRSDAGDVGSVSVALSVVPGHSLLAVSYTISAPAFSRDGTLDFSASGTRSTILDGLPAEDGYSIVVGATLSGGGSVVCNGSASFGVTVGNTTLVSIDLACADPPRRGGVQDGGAPDICTCVEPRPIVAINEVESSGGVPGDWVELYNAGTAAADLSTWVIKDNDDTHGYVLPAGTTLAAGGYLVIEEVALGFGLGAADAVRLYDATGTNLVDSYAWTSHAATTYGRCPNGVGPFTTTLSVTKGAANACPTGGTGGASGTDGGAAVVPWPGTDTVVTVDQVNQFAGNLSGLSYDPATSAGPAVLWAMQNSPPTLYRLLWNGTTWASTTTANWTAGKTLRYPDGAGTPDSEGVTRAEANLPAVYVSSERNGDLGTVSRLSVLRYDTDAPGAALAATHEWNLTADLPAVDPNLGLEAITWIPDAFLVGAGFLDDSTKQPYAPAGYANHGTGLFFVGLEANGTIYGYALDHVTGGFHRVATFPGGQASIMDLSFDRDVGYLWAACDNSCGNRAAVLQIDADPLSSTHGRFAVRRIFDRPTTLPDANNEGIAIAPESECAGGRKAFFWSDDSATGGNSIRRDAIPCGRFF